MAIGKALSAHGNNKLVIPYAGKMFKSSISKTNKALCFVINKGYFEVADLRSMLKILDEINGVEGFVLVGKIEKVLLKKNHDIVYRQRIFFKSLKAMLSVCKVFGLRFELGQDFHITINNVLNCVDDLVYLERYAAKFDEPIDVWLTNCCIIHLHSLLLNLGMHSSIGDKYKRALEGRKGYLDRAPFLISSYNIDKKSSAMFLELDTKDTRLYSKDIKEKLFIEYGYTDENVAEDIKGGVFK